MQTFDQNVFAKWPKVICPNLSKWHCINKVLTIFYWLSLKVLAALCQQFIKAVTLSSPFHCNLFPTTEWCRWRWRWQYANLNQHPTRMEEMIICERCKPDAFVQMAKYICPNVQMYLSSFSMQPTPNNMMVEMTICERCKPATQYNWQNIIGQMVHITTGWRWGWHYVNWNKPAARSSIKCPSRVVAYLPLI